MLQKRDIRQMTREELEAEWSHLVSLSTSVLVNSAMYGTYDQKELASSMVMLHDFLFPTEKIAFTAEGHKSKTSLKIKKLWRHSEDVIDGTDA